jgi:hypothetical protein
MTQEYICTKSVLAAEIYIFYKPPKWFSDIDNSSRGEYYSKFKTEFKLENYLLRLNAVHRNYICKLRTSVDYK